MNLTTDGISSDKGDACTVYPPPYLHHRPVEDVGGALHGERLTVHQARGLHVVPHLAHALQDARVAPTT